jgi:hypothetical protein
MGKLGDPFTLFGRLMIAAFKITGYFVTFIIQILWYALHRKTDKFAEAFGHLGRHTTDAIADILRD